MEMPADLYGLHAKFGIASEETQVLEVEAGNVALSFLAFFLGAATTADERDAFKSLVNDVNRKTLGNLLNRIRAIVTFDPTIIDMVDKALKRRNYLTHHFFRSHNFSISNVEGRKQTISKLREIRKIIDVAHASMSAVSDLLNTVASPDGKALDITNCVVARGKRIDI